MIKPQALGKLPRVPLQAKVFRSLSREHVAEGLSTRGSFEFGGRYNPSREFGVLYTSRSQQTSKAEKLKALGPGVRRESLVMAEIEIRLSEVIDLTREDSLKVLGLEKEAMTQPEEYEVTQTIGRWAKASGIEALIVPSAVAANSNVVVFLDNLKPGSSVKVLAVTEFPI